MEKNLYDRVVFFYDALASLVLGKGYEQSKLAFLDEISGGDSVLYIGGGTGSNLPEIISKVGAGGKVYFVEASRKMIKKASLKVQQDLNANIVFLHQKDFRDLPKGKFDIIITQYLLDILSEEDLEILFSELGKRSGAVTRWIFTDFIDQYNKRWLQNLMIFFFGLMTKNPRKDLPKYSEFFEKNGWEVKGRRFFKKAWIQSWLCVKTY